MNIKLLIIFIILNIFNVIIQTIKSIATVKCGKGIAALINAIAYGLYTIVVVYTMCDLPLSIKAIVVALCNLIGVWVVKYGEEKARKDKLWKVEATLKNDAISNNCLITLKKANISFNYINLEKYIIVNCYCPTQKESAIVKKILNQYNAKYFVSENKTL